MSNINYREASYVRHNKISDLRHKDYLEIDLCGFRYADVRGSFGGCFNDCFDDCFDDCFRGFVKKTKEMDLPQVRIKFPYGWAGFRRKLEKSCYRPGLIFVERDVSVNARLAGRLTVTKDASANTKPSERLTVTKDASANTKPSERLTARLTVLKNVNVAAGLLKKQQSLHYKFDPVFFEKPENFDIKSYLRQSQVNYKNGRGIAYGIHDEDKLVAFISLETLTDGIYINELFVDDKYRGQGFGKTLMQSGFSHATKLGFKKIWTTLAAENQRASLFYKSCGFRPTARLYYFDLV